MAILEPMTVPLVAAAIPSIQPGGGFCLSLEQVEDQILLLERRDAANVEIGGHSAQLGQRFAL